MPAAALADAQTPEDLFALLDAGTFFKLDGLVAVVTGGASGFGLMITTTLLANGAIVHVIDRSEENLENVKRIYGPIAAGRLFLHEGDASLKNEAERAAKAIAAVSSYVNVLFNNAGILGTAIPGPWGSNRVGISEGIGALNAIDEGSFHSVFAVNTIGPYFFSVAFLPLLCASQGHPEGKRFAPQIVNTCSVASFSKSTFGYLPYNLSKAALHHLTLTLAREFSSHRVRVNAFAPGYFITGMTSSDARTSLGFSPVHRTPSKDGESVSFVGAEVPVEQVGRFEDISGLVLMLTTNRFINGEDILIDGGMLLR